MTRNCLFLAGVALIIAPVALLAIELMFDARVLAWGDRQRDVQDVAIIAGLAGVVLLLLAGAL